MDSQYLQYVFRLLTSLTVPCSLDYEEVGVANYDIITM